MKSLGVYVCLSFASAATLVYGCSSNGGVDGDWSESGEVNAAPPSFEAYRDEARLASENGDVFLVEGDMLFDNEDNLQEYYEEVYLGSAEKSIINLVNGVRDVRPNPRNIRYCFSAGWGQNHGGYTAPALASVRTNIQNAMAEWETVANVKFTYRSSLDGATCNNNGANPGVDFVVTHWNSSSIATGASPVVFVVATEAPSSDGRY